MLLQQMPRQQIKEIFSKLSKTQLKKEIIASNKAIDGAIEAGDFRATEENIKVVEVGQEILKEKQNNT